MATIYSATDIKYNRKVALKIMHENLLDDEDLITKFLYEGDILEQLNRKYPDAPIVKVYRHSRESNDIHGRPFITLEYVEGKDLDDIIRERKKLSLSEIVFIIKETGRALSKAHKEDIWHRDVSPGNIIIQQSEGSVDKLTVIDFGVAKHEYLGKKTPDGSIHGKPPFMSPEQCRNEPLDGRSDLYSLGILFYTLIAGQPPFMSSNPLEVMKMHESAELPELPEWVPFEIKMTIEKMLEKNPDNRYQTVDEVIEKIEHFYEETLEPIADNEKETKKEPVVEYEYVKPDHSIEKSAILGINNYDIDKHNKLIKLVGSLIFIVIFLIGSIVYYIYKTDVPSLVDDPGDESFNEHSETELQQELDKGIEAFSRGDYGQCIRQMEYVLELDPGNSSAEHYLAEAANKKESMRIEKEIKDRLREGELAYQRGDYLNCIEHMEYVLELEPGNSRANYYLAEAANMKESMRIEEEIKDRIREGEMAYQRGDYQDCIEHMEYVLELDPGNSRAEHYLAEAANKKESIRIEEEIKDRIREAELAYQRGNYLDCIEQTKRVFKIDPNNAQAINISNSAHLKIAPVQIREIVDQYIQSINKGNPLVFCEKYMSQTLYPRMKNEYEQMSNMYRDLNSVYSDITIRPIGIHLAEVSFSNIITGIYTVDGRKLVIFEGMVYWNIERLDGSWQITKVNYKE